jgi:hypothetical protein
MIRPKEGICVEVHLAGPMDGDTCKVKLPGSEIVWKVRFKDVCCAEKNTDAGKLAARFVNNALEKAKRIMIWIPFDKEFKTEFYRNHNLLEALVSMNRVLGVVFLRSTESLGDQLVRMKLGKRPDHTGSGTYKKT